MTIYKKGSKGAKVKEIQKALKAKGYYKIAIDGDFGKGTLAAVKNFQKDTGLTVDGIVGPDTWKHLFKKQDKKKNSRASEIEESMNYKCLTLTGSFETGKQFPECFSGISGDFDGQGLSLGVLQWNFGQNTLQPLLKEMIKKNPKIVKTLFNTISDKKYDDLVKALNSDKEKLMEFARSIQHPVKHYIYKPWKKMFKLLGETTEFRDLQVKYSKKQYRSALKLCSDYGLWSERGIALMFDIKVQNGSISRAVKGEILKAFDKLPKRLSKENLEVRKMRIIANKRAEASNPRWIEDVRSRKLCCANSKGIVHGVNYDLDKQFAIGLEKLK